MPQHMPLTLALQFRPRQSVRGSSFGGSVRDFLLLGLPQLDDLPTLIGKSQLMAKPFALANDGLALGFPFLVELVDILHRSPVRNVPRLAFPEEAVQHAAAGQQSDVSFMQ